MSNWHCDACGQPIRHAREGWISFRNERGHASVTLAHHHIASPWATWGGCAPADELASLHLHDALRDARALAELVALELLDADQLAVLHRRLRGRSQGERSAQQTRLAPAPERFLGDDATL